MSRSTFNGPVLVGIDDATFSMTRVDYTGPNWGFVNMSQSATIEQSGPVVSGPRWVGITIPYKSVITKVSLLITAAWSSAAGKHSVYGAVGVAWGTVPAVNGDVTPNHDDDELAGFVDLMTVGNHVVSGSSTPSVLDLSAETQGTGSPELINVDTSDLRVGMMIRDGATGTTTDEVAKNTFILSIDDETTLTMTKNAISDQVTTLDFMGTGTSGADINSWMNVGSKHGGSSLPSTDRMIVFDEHDGLGNDGTGVLTVNYCQAVDLSAIA